MIEHRRECLWKQALVYEIEEFRVDSAEVSKALRLLFLPITRSIHDDSQNGLDDFLRGSAFAISPSLTSHFHQRRSIRQKVN